MKKIVSLIMAAAITVCAFAAPKPGVDVELPTTQSTVLDDFEDGMYFAAVRDTWDSFGNVFGKQQFSDSEGTKARWDGDGNCGVLHYTDLPGNSLQSCIYECQELPEENWKNYGWLSVTVHNPNDYPLSIQMFTKSGPNWAWGNSPDAPTVEPGTHTILYKINAQSVQINTKVVTLGFSCYVSGVHPAGEIYIDNVTLYNKK